MNAAPLRGSKFGLVGVILKLCLFLEKMALSFNLLVYTRVGAYGKRDISLKLLCISLHLLCLGFFVNFVGV